MSYIALGKLIHQIRTEQKISLEKLGRGLCSKQALSDIERGNVQADKLLSDIVLQRLGKSTDKQEVILPWEAYHLEETLDSLEKSIQQGEEELAGKYRKELAKLIGKKDSFKERNNKPAEREDCSKKQNDKLDWREDSPKAQNDKLVGREDSSTEQNDKLAEKEDSPTEQNNKPTEKEDGSIEENDKLARMEDSPTERNDKPAEGNDKPAEKNDSPTEQNNKLAKKENKSTERENKLTKKKDKLTEKQAMKKANKYAGNTASTPGGKQRIDRVREMYWHRVMAQWAYWLDKDAETARRELLGAVNLTLPGWWQQKLECYVISTVEMENLLAVARLELEARARRYAVLTAALQKEIWNERWQPVKGVGCGEEAPPGEGMTLPGFLWECIHYIRRHFTDVQEQVKIFSKCAWLLSYVELERGNVLEAYAICEEAVEGLRDHGISTFLLPMLERLLICCERAGQICGQAKQEGKVLSYAWQRDWQAIGERYGRYLQALRRAYVKCGLSGNPAVSIFMKCYQKSYHLDYEFIRSERIAQGMTREKMVEGVYQNQKTLWQIEVKHNSPHGKNFRLLMDKIDSDKGRYNTYVVSDSFEVLELKDEIDRCLGRREYEKAQELIRLLERRLDMQNTENQRIILHMWDVLGFGQEDVPCRAMLQKCWGLLGQSYRIKGFETDGIPDKKKLQECLFYRVPMKAEIGIINQIAVLLRRLQYEDEAAEIYKAALRSMEESDVAPHYRYRLYVLPLGGLAKLLNSAKISQKAIFYELSCGKMGSLGYTLMAWARAMEDDSPDRAESRGMILDAYYLCELSKNYRYREEIKKYYDEQYETL